METNALQRAHTLTQEEFDALFARAAGREGYDQQQANIEAAMSYWSVAPERRKKYGDKVAELHDGTRWPRDKVVLRSLFMDEPWSAPDAD